MTKDYLSILTDEERRLLKENHFEERTFEGLRERFRQGNWTAKDNQVRGTVELPEKGDIRPLSDADSEEGRRLAQIGRDALASGEVGALVLNGGMATRFGGVVKGCVDVFDDVCFLGLKLADAKNHGSPVPVLLMNSFATDEKTRQHLESRNYYGFPKDQLITYTQNISMRLTPEGEIFRTEQGDTLYAPGHGDVAEATRRSALDEFRDRGGKYLLMSNVDNVLATLDPLVVGTHIDAVQTRGVEMTAEVVDNQGSTTGGMPARVDSELQIVEAFRFPEDFDASSIPVYNTNTFMFNADALDQDFDLTWFVVEKTVQERPAIQFERLAGQLSAFLSSQFVQVPRTGVKSRFLPIKRREDLEENREFLRRAVGEKIH